MCGLIAARLHGERRACRFIVTSHNTTSHYTSSHHTDVSQQQPLTIPTFRNVDVPVFTANSVHCSRYVKIQITLLSSHIHAGCPNYRNNTQYFVSCLRTITQNSLDAFGENLTNLAFFYFFKENRLLAPWLDFW